MRALIALVTAPTVIAAVILVARLLTLVTGDVMSAVMLELIAFVFAVALFSHEPRHTGRAHFER